MQAILLGFQLHIERLVNPKVIAYTISTTIFREFWLKWLLYISNELLRLIIIITITKVILIELRLFDCKANTFLKFNKKYNPNIDPSWQDPFATILHLQPSSTMFKVEIFSSALFRLAHCRIFTIATKQRFFLSNIFSSIVIFIYYQLQQSGWKHKQIFVSWLFKLISKAKSSLKLYYPIFSLFQAHHATHRIILQLLKELQLNLRIKSLKSCFLLFADLIQRKILLKIIIPQFTNN